MFFIFIDMSQFDNEPIAELRKQPKDCPRVLSYAR